MAPSAAGSPELLRKAFFLGFPMRDGFSFGSEAFETLFAGFVPGSDPVAVRSFADSNDARCVVGRLLAIGAFAPGAFAVSAELFVPPRTSELQRSSDAAVRESKVL